MNQGLACADRGPAHSAATTERGHRSDPGRGAVLAVSRSFPSAPRSGGVAEHRSQGRQAGAWLMLLGAPSGTSRWARRPERTQFAACSLDRALCRRIRLARACASLFDASEPFADQAQRLARAKYESARGALQRASETLVGSRAMRSGGSSTSSWLPSTTPTGCCLATFGCPLTGTGFWKPSRKSEHRCGVRDRRASPVLGRKAPEVSLQFAACLPGPPRGLIFCRAPLCCRQALVREVTRVRNRIFSCRAPPCRAALAGPDLVAATLCGYATGRLALDVLSLKMSDDGSHGYVIHQLHWLNRSAGLRAARG